MPKEIDELFGDFTDTVNMSVGELESWKDSDNFAEYTKRKSGGQPPTEPIDDAIRLLETNKSGWEDKDDGFNEVEEANELINFVDRMSKNNRGDPIPDTDPELSKRDASLLSWAFDPNPDTSDFVGDRQR